MARKISQAQPGRLAGSILEWEQRGFFGLVIAFIVLLLIGGGIYFGLVYRRPEPPKSPAVTAPTAPLTSPAELPLLFPGLTIKQHREGVMFETEDLDGPSQIQGTSVEANVRNPEDEQLVLGLFKYYYDYFMTRDWDFYLSASGPTGDLEGWKKNGRYFILDIQFDPKSRTRSAFLHYTDI